MIAPTRCSSKIYNHRVHGEHSEFSLIPQKGSMISVLPDLRRDELNLPSMIVEFNRLITIFLC